MKKWIIPCLSLILIAALIFVSSPYYSSRKVTTLDKGTKTIPAIFGRMEDKEEKEKEDTNLVILLKNLQEILDGWLKSINEKIESEDGAKIEVRFLEILRSILEWIKEKIDAKIQSSPPPQRKAEWLGSFRA